MIDLFAKRVIEFHGFSSNYVTGFSCYIPDSKEFPQTEGLLIWNYSNAYSRFETQIQKFSSKARIYRMNEMLSLNSIQYRNQIQNKILKYAETLLSIDNFKKIGNGVKLFGNVNTFNIGADFTQLENNYIALKEFELWTINNPIVKFAENNGYFKCLNKDRLVYDEIYN